MHQPVDTEEDELVEVMETALEGELVTPFVRQAMAEVMGRHIRDRLSEQSVTRKIFLVSPIDLPLTKK